MTNRGYPGSKCRIQQVPEIISNTESLDCVINMIPQQHKPKKRYVADRVSTEPKPKLTLLSIEGKLEGDLYIRRINLDERSSPRDNELSSLTFIEGIKRGRRTI